MTRSKRILKLSGKTLVYALKRPFFLSAQRQFGALGGGAGGAGAFLKVALRAEAGYFFLAPGGVVEAGGDEEHVSHFVTNQLPLPCIAQPEISGHITREHHGAAVVYDEMVGSRRGQGHAELPLYDAA
jgi:hypothetical protein